MIRGCMRQESFEALMHWTEKWIGAGRVVWIVRLLTDITAGCYLAGGFLLATQSHFRELAEYLLIPAVCLLVISVARKKLGVRRPYEVYGFTPLIPRTDRGDSFPSRHAFSNFIIAMAVLRVWWPAGAVLFVTGTVLCFLRVAAGVHYPKDVIVGGILGIFCGGLGFFLL